MEHASSQVQGLVGIALDLAESGRDADKVALLLSAAGALWDLRVLDAWHDQHGMRIPAPQVWDKFKPGQEYFAEAVIPDGQPEREVRFLGVDPDACRSAVAQAVLRELPDDVRLGLGERP